MFTDPQYQSLLQDIQAELDAKCPSPEEDLGILCEAVANTPNTARYVDMRSLAFEIDDLIAQVRWHLGQMLLLVRAYPEMLVEHDDQFFWDSVIEVSSLLRIRRAIREPELVMFAEPMYKRPGRGGIAGMWILQMLLDSSIARSISIMDRMAKMVSLVAEVYFDKYYFRSKKLERVHQKLAMPETRALVDLSLTPIFDYLLKHRDGSSHDKKTVHAILSGFIPVDRQFDVAGNQMTASGISVVTPGDMCSLANAAYQQVLAGLHLIASICQQRITETWPDWVSHIDPALIRDDNVDR